MTKAQRVRKILAGLFSLIGCFIMLRDTELGYYLRTAIVYIQ